MPAEVIMLPKASEGIRLRQAGHKNLALLSSLTWILFSQPHSLCAKILITKYDMCNPKSLHSFIWSNIQEGEYCVQKQ